ncbi:MAG: GNAT family N-acetyltransferase [Fidelibacterota bacterium]
MGKILIRENKLADARTVLDRLPEFDDPVPVSEFETRLADRTHLILTAYRNETPVACKIGYDRQEDGSFYSWLGGVLPEFRRRGIARKLLTRQESWAKQKGFVSVRVKTRLRYTAMLRFLQREGYCEIHRIERQPERETRLIFEKQLTENES